MWTTSYDLRIILVALVAVITLYVLLRPPPPGACQTPAADACAGPVAALHEVGGANPCMLVAARVGGYHTAFCVDTGFAGPCLLSLPCLALAPPLPADAAGVQSWCEKVQEVLGATKVSATRQQAALEAFVRDNRCSDFTSGCTMRLASIGTTKESTSNMLLAPPLELATPDGTGFTAPRACSGQPVAEVLASTPMPTVHLLTCDWLVQNSPALLKPHEGVIVTNMSEADFAAERKTLHRISTELSGGAFVATVRVAGVPLRVTVDSGAACYLSVGKQAADKLRKCEATGKTMRQVGANGEHICSHAVRARVEMGGASEDVPVLVNDMDLGGEDGYLGYCFLRHFDLCVVPGAMFARRNKAPFDAGMLDQTLSDKPCSGSAPACAA